MSKETKIGLLTLLTIIFGVWGYMFLKGRNILSREKIVYVEYNDVQELTESSPVYLNGFQIGVVSDIKMKENDAHKVLVAITLRRDINVPKNATAQLVSLGVMGGKAIKIAFDKPCNGADCVVNDDYLVGVSKSMLGSLMTPDEVSLYMERMRNGVGGVMDSLDASFRQNDSEIGQTLRDVQSSVANLKVTTALLANLVANTSKGMTGTLNNLESISANLQQNNAKISAIMDDSKKFTSKLNALELDKTVVGANDAMAKMKTTLVTSEKTIADLNSVINDIKKGQGSLGELIYSDKTVKNLNEAVTSLDMLSRELTVHPKRYRSILWGKERVRTPLSNDAEYKKYLIDRDSVKIYTEKRKQK